DIACGEGYGSYLLAAKAASVTGMDIDNTTINKAAQKYPKDNLRFTQAAAEKIPAADAQFDMVVSIETLEHLADHDTMIKEIKRVLKPGGLLVISTPDKKNYSDKRNYKNPFHLKELYRNEFEALLKSAFSQVRIYDQQMTYSSFINEANATGLTTYSGNYSSIEKNKPGEALYLLALAADSDLPTLPNSLFTGQSIVEQALAERERMVTNTLTYKLGHVLLYPFKLLRGIFKN
ncbi:MAG: class I SAM-dependent methyltransferase, partial [Chitinophagaceae bacterium]|nr:class I SAM-dependent methyltransferase [Chitinophagaceae bacterium]